MHAVGVVLVQPDPPCTQEYKWRELEEQRQAQKLQRQLQQEQAYLLSLQQNQNLDSSKPAQQQSTKPPQDLELDRVKPPQSPSPPDTANRPAAQSGDCEKTQRSHSLEKTTDTKLPVADLQGPAPDSESVREVNPRSSTAVERFPLLVCVLPPAAVWTWTWVAAGVGCVDACRQTL